MSKRAINPDEGDFAVSASNATAGATKQTARFDLIGASVQAVMSSGSYLIQASNNNADWVAVGGAITASGMTTLSAQYRYLRIFTTTSGDAEFFLMTHELLY